MSGFTLNYAVVSGNLTRDPEARTTPGGTELCKLRIAVNDRVKNKTTTSGRIGRTTSASRSSAVSARGWRTT